MLPDGLLLVALGSFSVALTSLLTKELNRRRVSSAHCPKGFNPRGREDVKRKGDTGRAPAVVLKAVLWRLSPSDDPPPLTTRNNVPVLNPFRGAFFD